MILLDIALAASLLTFDDAQGGGQVEVTMNGVRNRRGQLHLCLTRNSSHFPNCANDPAAIKRTVPASTRQVSLALSPGDYALSVFHDENGDRDLNTFLGIPQEGFGFSLNPRVRFGPPRFRDVLVAIPQGFTRISVRMQYML